MNTKKLILLSSIITIPIVSYSEPVPVSVDIHAQVGVIMPLGISNITDMNLGSFDFPQSADGGEIHFSPDGTIDTGETGFVSDNSATPGSFKIESVTGETVQITCDADGILYHADDESASIAIKQTRFAVNGDSVMNCGDTTTGSFGSAGNDTISVGTTLVVPSGVSAQPGTYSTNNHQGESIVFNISYQ